jgi:peptide-methionine (S)-S-oxide reductase
VPVRYGSKPAPGGQGILGRPASLGLMYGREEDAVSIFGLHKTRMATAEDALPGRGTAMPVPARHEVLGTSLRPPYPAGTQVAEFALGCFWGAERTFWRTPGVVSTAVGYEGGFTPNPTYEEVCSGRTGHAEAVRVVFDPEKVSYEELLRIFWESHDPTQGMRQGNDVGTQYRSSIFYQSPQQQAEAEASSAAYQKRLTDAGYGQITTEIVPAGEFYFAEDYHQQYLSSNKNPNGYCPDHGTGVSCPVGVVKASD